MQNIFTTVTQFFLFWHSTLL